MQQLPRTQLCRGLWGGFVMKQMILQIGSREVHHHPNNWQNISTQPWSFWPQQYLVTTGTCGFACPTCQVYSICCCKSHMEGRCSEEKATQQASSQAKSVNCESLAFLSSDSVCKLFLFSFCRPGFIPVHCENKPDICRERIKNGNPIQSLRAQAWQACKNLALGMQRQLQSLLGHKGVCLCHGAALAHPALAPTVGFLVIFLSSNCQGAEEFPRWGELAMVGCWVPTKPAQFLMGRQRKHYKRFMG